MGVLVSLESVDTALRHMVNHRDFISYIFTPISHIDAQGRLNHCNLYSSFGNNICLFKFISKATTPLFA